MIYNLIAFLAATSFATGHVITAGKFENRISSPDTKVNLGQAQIDVENKLTKGKLIGTLSKIKSTIETPEKFEETGNVENPLTLNVPEQVRTKPIKQFLQPVIQSQSQTIADVRTGIPYYFGYPIPYYFTGKSHRLALPIQLQADKSEFNIANLKTLPVDNLNLLSSSQIQAINSKFNVANLQTYGRGERKLFTPKYFRYPAKYFPEFYNFPTTTYSPYGIGSNLASPQLNFQVGELANVGQSGKF